MYSKISILKQYFNLCLPFNFTNEEKSVHFAIEPACKHYLKIGISYNLLLGSYYFFNRPDMLEKSLGNPAIWVKNAVF